MLITFRNCEPHELIMTAFMQKHELVCDHVQYIIGHVLVGNDCKLLVKVFQTYAPSVANYLEVSSGSNHSLENTH